MRVAGCLLLALLLTQALHARTFVCARAGSSPTALKQLVEASSLEEAACSLVRSNGMVPNGSCTALALCEEIPSGATPSPPAASAAASSAQPAAPRLAETVSNAPTCMRAAADCTSRCGMGHPGLGAVQDFAHTNCTQRCELIRARCVLSPPPLPTPAQLAASAPAQPPPPQPPPRQKLRPTEAFTCLSPGKPRADLMASSVDDARSQYLQRNGPTAKPPACMRTGVYEQGRD